MYIYDAIQKPTKTYQEAFPFKDSSKRVALAGKTKGDFQTYVKSIRGLACATNVSEDYITRQFPKNNFYGIIGRKIVKDGVGGRKFNDIDPIGFVMAKKELEETDFYIDIICSVEYGQVLLQYVIQLAEEKGCRSITLNSLPTVLAYYPRFGFRYGKSCDSTIAIPELATFSAYVSSLGQHKPKTSPQAYADPAYVEFMRVLHGHNLNKKTAAPHCNKGAAITANDIRDGECGEDGYTMVKCLATGGGRRRQQTARRRRTNRRLTRRHR